ncbi:MAG: hypothetical protein K0S76_2196 [Herbinix sp.]|jgi:molecular chaperone DnaK (HSP70)|nr:hypothetical protein [Herbinix sp.]
MRIFKDFNNEELQCIHDGSCNVIGLDFGDGETTAAYFNPIQNAPCSFFIDGSGARMKMITALFVPNDRPSDVKVGMNAINASKNRLPGRFYVNFKCKPSEADAYAEFIGERRLKDKLYTKKEIMQLFVQKFLDTIFEISNNELKGERETIVLVGRPAGGNWEGEEEQNYQKMLAHNLMAGGRSVKRVMVLSESFAALAQTVGKNNKKFAFDDTIICADSGSSTFDFTCVSQGENKSEYGVSLGAKYIEQNMLNHTLELINKKSQSNYAVADIADPVALFQMRTCKENFYGDEGQEPQQMQPFMIQIRDQYFVEQIDRSFMEYVINNMKVEYNDKTQPKGISIFKSWNAGCETFFENARKGIQNEIAKVKKVILTGGGSKMPFLVNQAMKTFGQNIVEISHEPSYTVARGLAWIAQHEVKTEILYREIISGLEEIITNAIEADLTTKIATPLAAEMLDGVIWPILNDWKNRKYATLDDVSKAMDQKCNDLMKNGYYQPKINQAVGEWFNENYPKVIQELNKKIESGLNVRIPDNYQMRLPKGIYENIQNSVQLVQINVNAGEFLNRVLGKIGAGWVLFNHDHIQSDRDKLFANALNIYPNGLLNGFNAMFGLKYVEGLVTQIRKGILSQYTGSDTIYTNILHELEASLSESIANQIEMMAMYVYKQKDV